MNGNSIVQKLWKYCNILRDDGLSYQDCIEQLTFLLFPKMADERQKLLPDGTILIPRALDWNSLERLDDDLDQHYRHILVELYKRPGMLGTIFRTAQNRIQDPAKLKRLISDLTGRETRTTLSVDVKGDAGQYFTPRASNGDPIQALRAE
jgi:type I restriction enzyme M protein